METLEQGVERQKRVTKLQAILAACNTIANLHGKGEIGISIMLGYLAGRYDEGCMHGDTEPCIYLAILRSGDPRIELQRSIHTLSRKEGEI